MRRYRGCTCTGYRRGSDERAAKAALAVAALVGEEAAMHLRRLDRADLGNTAEPTRTDTSPWRQCPHRPSARPLPAVIEAQQSFGVVAVPWPAGDRAPAMISLRPDRTTAEADRDRDAGIKVRIDLPPRYRTDWADVLGDQTNEPG